MRHDRINPCCDGKERFRNKGAAELVIRARQKKHRLRTKHRTSVNAYPCRDCGGWHIGSLMK